MENSKFVTELASVINKNSKENGSNTPDFILAEFLEKTLTLFDETIRKKNLHVNGEIGFRKSVKDVLQERYEQIHVHGHTVESDISHDTPERMVSAVRCLLKNAPNLADPIPPYFSRKNWNHMIAKSYRERIVISTALLLAELDILDALSKEECLLEN